MFKKIEIWILYLTIFLSILFAIGFGILVRQELVGDIKAGWVSKSALFLAEIPSLTKCALFCDINLEDRFNYLGGFEGDPNEQEAFMLLSRFNGDIMEGVVELIDLTTFKSLHVWNPDLDALNQLVNTVNSDEFNYLTRDSNDARQNLIHPLLTSDGGLLFTNWASPLRKIDSDSELVFQNSTDRFHHSIETDSEDNIWVPARVYPHLIDSKYVGSSLGAYLDDAIVKLSPDGDVIFIKSVSEIFIENEMEYLLFSMGHPSFFNDPIHLNDIQPVNFDSLYWKKGDVFLSLRSQSMVMLYRPSTNKIIWHDTGKFYHQHDVDILDESRISILNNNSKFLYNGDVVDGHNEVLIYDFSKDEYIPYLSASLILNDVRTVGQGRSEILPNGDLFFEETEFGRTLYFNSDGSLRWTHLNRSSNGEIHWVGWSRILTSEEDLNKVRKFLDTKVENL
jgi:hypothetical protein